jgi:gliding motility-associated-like protein
MYSLHSDSINLEIIPKPTAAFEYIHFKSQGNQIPFKFNNRSQKESSWYWDFGNGDTSMLKNPDYRYSDTGKYRVQLIVGRQGKCFDTSRQIVPVYHDIAFYFPNVFSPNGNRINESFGLSAGQWFKVASYSLKIYNRWGQVVYEAKNYRSQWKGKDTSGNDLSDGTYYYEVVLSNDKAYTGHVTLLR